MGLHSNTTPAPEDGRISIVHLVTSLEPGGLENGVVNLANSLDPDRFRTGIVCLERIGEFAGRLNSGVGLVCVEKPPGFHGSAGKQVRLAVNEFRADVIHTHNLGPLIYGIIARRFGKCGGVIVQGEHAELRADERAFRRRAMRRIGYRSCAAVHAVSHGLRDDLIALGLPPEKIRVILNGVDCERFSPVSRDKRAALRPFHGIPKSAIVIGIVGRFGTFKRHSRLIAAFNRLAGRFPDLHLLIVGDHGPEKERVVALCDKSEYRDRISRAGFQKDPAPWYQMMNLLIIPSDNEGLSNAMLEAMASGVPCLAHPACGASEVIRDGQNGCLRPVGDEGRLAGEIETLVENPDLVIELGKAARETALERFSLDAMIEGYSKLYDEVGAE